MTQEQENRIDKIIKDYHSLVEHAKNTANLLNEIDEKEYYTAKGVISIDIEDDIVYVTCDDSCMGCWDEHSFRFPVRFLSVGKEELTEIVLKQKEDREKEQERKEIQKKENDRRIKEEMDRQQYELLKQKFENQEKL